MGTMTRMVLAVALGALASTSLAQLDASSRAAPARSLPSASRAGRASVRAEASALESYALALACAGSTDEFPAPNRAR